MAALAADHQQEGVMSLSDLTHGSFSGFAAGFGKNPAASAHYATFLTLGIAFLAAPVLVVAALVRLLDLPQPLLFPMSVGILVVDLYLAARLSHLWAYVAGTGRLPRRAMWRLPAGMAWKLAAVLLLAPWPFDIAFAVLGPQAHVYLQVPVMLLAALAAMAGVAVMAMILAEAWRLARRA
jgi:hypothetical protein